MANVYTVPSIGLNAASATAASQVITGTSGIMQNAGRIIVTNRLASEVFLRIDGTTAVSAAAGTYLLPGVIGSQVVVGLPVAPSEDDADALAAVTLSAIGAATWSIWIQATY